MIQGLKTVFGDTDKTILEEAGYLIDEKRRTQYGPAWVNFQRIADLWTAYLSGRVVGMHRVEGGEEPITMDDVAFMMSLLKIARHADGGGKIKRDNVVDIVGYMRCIERIREEQKGERLKDGN